MSYEETPNYNKIRKLFVDALKKCGLSDDGVSICLPTAATQVFLVVYLGSMSYNSWKFEIFRI